MIVSISGPDRVGKTTLWANLRRIVHGATFIPTFPMDGKLIPVADLVVARNAALWEALYDRRELYIVDRFFAVDCYAYALRYNRDVDAARRLLNEWRDEIRCLLLSREKPFASDPVETDHAEALRCFAKAALTLECRNVLFDDSIQAAFYAAEHIRSWRTCLEQSWTA